MQTNIKIVDTTIHENLGVEIDREIGRGKYGIVYNGVRVDTGKDCAVKVISLPNPELEEKLRDIYGDDENAIENLSREMASRFENEIKSMSIQIERLSKELDLLKKSNSNTKEVDDKIMKLSLEILKREKIKKDL